MLSIERAQEFLDFIFGNVDPDDKLHHLIWCAPSKASRFFTDTKASTAYSIEQAAKQNVYFGLGLTRTPPAEGRGLADNIDAITCLWADIDIADPLHKKTNLPKSNAEALSVLQECGVAPSLIIGSGHGLQAYWMLREPWVFDGAADKMKAAKLVRMWNATILAVFEKAGFTVDATHDLTRVFRVAGTMNLKDKDKPKPVTLYRAPIEGQVSDFNPSDFDNYLIAEEFAKGTTSRTFVASVEPVLPRDSGVPPIIEALCENDPRFKKTWQRKRGDLGDQSPSGYELSLASFMVAAGCTDQDIADAMLAWRRKHGLDEKKLQRRDYIMRTLSRARSTSEADAALAKVEEMTHTVSIEAEPEEKAQQRSDALDGISKGLGVKIKRFIKHGAENATYSLVLADGKDVLLGKIATVLSQDRFRERLADAEGVVIRTVKRDRWHRVISILLGVAELVENIEATREGKMTGWLRSYITHFKTIVHSGDGWKNALSKNAPFIREGELWIHKEDLARELKFNSIDRIDSDQIWDGLRLLGFQGKRVSARYGEKTIGRHYWHAPLDQIGLSDLVSKPQRARAEEGADDVPI